MGTGVVAAAVVAVLALAGCGASEHVEPTKTGEAGVDWQQPWKDASGKNAPATVVTTYRGAEHCGWQSKVFLVLGWPLGTPARDLSTARTYVRDADGEFDEYLSGRFDGHARLPRKARATGYHLDGVELWLGPAAKAAYIVARDRIERWPRARNAIACA